MKMPETHLEWAEYWGRQCLSAMSSYEAHGFKEALEHAIRSARLAWMHVCKAKKYPYWQPEKL